MSQSCTGSLHTSPSALTLTAVGGQPLLEIRFDGTIVWSGPPSRGSRALLNSVRSVLDLDVIGDQAAERIYRRAVEKCLRLAKTMDRDELVDRLEQEMQARISNAVLIELKNE